MRERPERLRSVLDRGADPLVGLDDDDIDRLAREAAQEHPEQPRINWDAFIDRSFQKADACDAPYMAVSRSVLWGMELECEADLRPRLLACLPLAARARLEGWLDMSARPFPLEVEHGTFRCGHCGREATGRHVRIVDRLNQLEEVPAWCGDCLATVVSMLSASDP